MMFCMTNGNIELDPYRLIKRQNDVFGDHSGKQADMLREWKKRYGDAPSQGHMSKVEAGMKGLSIERLAQLSDVLETNIEYLLGMIDDDAPLTDLEDQVVFGIRSEEERRLLRVFGKEFLKLPPDKQKFVVELIEQFSSGGKGPNIIE